MMLMSRLLHRPWIRTTKQFRWQLLVLLPWFIPLVTYLLLGPPYLSRWSTFLGATGLNVSLAISCQLVLDGLTQRVTAYYPGLHQSGKRLLWLLLVFITVTSVFVLGALWGYTRFHWFGYVAQPGILPRILVVNGVANLVSAGTFESMYSLTNWRDNMLEKEQLKKANLQSQYESLKNQVNPHFLFNTLNTLSSLIADEPERAEEFVLEMAKVYRYLLQTNQDSIDSESGLTTLAVELTFIRSYFHLLKTRYGTGIELAVAVDPVDFTALLPPLTLQMLVENAVKHNVIHVHKPLRIDIQSAPGGYLLVRNNRQPRTGRSDRRPALSTKVGLNNIRATYQLLAGRQAGSVAGQPDAITIDENETDFTLYLPLLNQTRP